MLKGLIRWLELCSHRNDPKITVRLHNLQISTTRGRYSRYLYRRSEYSKPRRVSTLLKGLIRWLELCSHRNDPKITVRLHNLQISTTRGRYSRYLYRRSEYSKPRRVSTLLKGLIRWLELCSHRNDPKITVRLHNLQISTTRGRYSRYLYRRSEYSKPRRVSTLLKGLIRWLELCSHRNDPKITVRLHNLQISTTRGRYSRYLYRRSEYSKPRRVSTLLKGLIRWLELCSHRNDPKITVRLHNLQISTTRGRYSRYLYRRSEYSKPRRVSTLLKGLIRWLELCSHRNDPKITVRPT